MTKLFHILRYVITFFIPDNVLSKTHQTGHAKCLNKPDFVCVAFLIFFSVTKAKAQCP